MITIDVGVDRPSIIDLALLILDLNALQILSSDSKPQACTTTAVLVIYTPLSKIEDYNIIYFKLK